MKLKHLAIVSVSVVGACTFSFFEGGIAAHHQLDTKYAAQSSNTVIHTKTIEHETVTVKNVPTLPESCAEALDAAKLVDSAFAHYEATGGDLAAIANTLSSAIVLQQIKTLNQARVKINSYSDKVTDISTDLGDARNTLDRVLSDCLTETDQ